MANSKQANKRIRTSEHARQRNKVVRSAMRTAEKKVRQAVEAGDRDGARALVPEAMKRIDKAAKNHVIHKNAAAHAKSRISRAVN